MFEAIFGNNYLEPYGVDSAVATSVEVVAILFITLIVIACVLVAIKLYRTSDLYAKHLATKQAKHQEQINKRLSSEQEINDRIDRERRAAT